MYFLRRTTPVHLGRERLQNLRVSLNSPVVATPELPPGPARAAIIVHRELEGHLAVSVGVRSLKSGDAALWTADASFEGEGEIAVAIDAALSFAESMGFLFDEEVAAGTQADRDRGKAHWEELMGSSGGGLEPGPGSSEVAEAEIELSSEAELAPEPVPDPVFDAAADALAAEIGPSEFELTEALEGEPARADTASIDAAESAELPSPREAEPDLAPGGAKLSKFRGRLASKRSAAPRKPLARVALVKRRADDDDAPSWLQRALVFF